MPHGLESCIPILRRWGQLTAKPMPTDWATFERANPGEALNIRTVDNELFQLLSGTASATLRADALSGSISPVTPDPQKIADEARREKLQSLVDSQPFGGTDAEGRPIPPNLTKQLELAALDPTLAAKFKQQSSAPVGDFDAEAQRVAQQKAATQRAIIASKNGFSGSVD